MLETLAVYGELAPLEIGVLLFPLGLVAGSFSSVLYHRLPVGLSIVGPRSQCHLCRHPLRVRDLVPLVSYLWLRGKCRYCAGVIPVKYPMLELFGGALAAVAGALGGWSYGLLALIGWICVAMTLGVASRVVRSQSGTSLVEVLIAVGLLVTVAIPMLDLGAYMRGATPFHRQIAVSLAASKLEELANIAYRTSNSTWPGSGSDSVDVGRYTFDREWVQTDAPEPPDFRFEAGQLKHMVVTVTCQNCPAPMPPVRVVTLIAKL